MKPSSSPTLAALALAALGVAGLIPQTAAAQVTATDYARAEAFLGWNTENLVSGDRVDPQWIDGGDRFWYRNHVLDGWEFILVDPARRRRAPAFDHDRLAAALSLARDTSYEGHKLPFDEVELVNGDREIRFFLGDSARWRCDVVAYRCTGPDSIARRSDGEILSPDGRWAAFTRDENLWVRDVESGEERSLSTDGERDWGYGVPIEACCSAVTSPRRKIDEPPVLVWSPDSRRIATHRFDERNVRVMGLLETDVKGPVLWTYHNALPGDSVIPTWDVWVFDPEGGAGVRADRPPQPYVNTSCCRLTTNGPDGEPVWKDARWGTNADELFYTVGERSFDTLTLVAMDVATGATRTVLTETSPTYVEANVRSGGVPNWRVVSDNREVVWFSERDGWGHLYLYDAATGALKNRITQGPWLVVDLLRVDDVNRWVYFTAVGREAGEDPYQRHLYRTRMDGSAIELLTPGDADHEVRISPSGQYVVDTYSTRASTPVTVLRSAAGAELLTLERADFAALLDTGWQWPVPFRTKARDGTTDVYGYLYFPRHMEEGKRYPVIDYIYPGPQTGPIGWRQATTGPRGNGPALAELGFIVFTIDAMGTPLRSKAFHDAYYGNMVDNGIPDHIAALKALALRYPQIDLDRVGIYGHSGGGFSSTDAILHYPDFFKVAVSSSGNHDNRSYDYTWGEKYQGLLEREEGGGDNFDSQANHLAAGNLKGRLLLVYGTLDDNVHPNATLLLVDELIEHNKTFDMLVMPNRNHGYTNDPYLIRRTWDYFVEHLLGEEPPVDYAIRPPGAG